MSNNKNLKVYKMQFITDLKRLSMAVKFACKMKATWKRSIFPSINRQRIWLDNMGSTSGWCC
jgi:hypothetical protein